MSFGFECGSLACGEEQDRMIAEIDRLRARVAELEQIEMDAKVLVGTATISQSGDLCVDSQIAEALRSHLLSAHDVSAQRDAEVVRVEDGKGGQR